MLVIAYSFAPPAEEEGNIFYRCETISNLSFSKVTDIFQDHIGYVWVGTNYGLNRYDGYEVIKYFREANDSSSLPSDKINAVYEDQMRHIWVSTSKGLALYDRVKDCFVRYDELTDRQSVYGIYEENGEVWFSTGNNRFLVYNLGNNKFLWKEIRTPEKDRKITALNIRRFDQTRFLLNNNGQELLLYDKNTGNTRLFYKDPNSRIRKIEVLQDRIYCQTSRKGIFVLNKEGDLIHRKNLSQKSRVLFLDLEYNPRENSLWISTDGDGVYVLDTALRVIRHLSSGPTYNEILPENSITRIFFGSGNSIWLGTVRSGLLMISPSKLERFWYQKGNVLGLSNKTVLCFFEDEDHRIWIGTDGGGLDLFNKNTYSFKNYKYERFEKIISITGFDQDHLLISSFAQGLWFFDKRNGKVFPAHVHPLFKDLTIPDLSHLFQDSKGNIWVGLEHSLLVINKKRTRRKEYTDKDHPELEGKKTVFFIGYEDPFNTIWFGYSDGLYSFDMKHERFTFHGSIGEIRSIASYDEHTLILAVIPDGLVYFDKNTGHFRSSSLKRDPKYKHAIFYNVFVDSSKNIWSGTSRGLVKIVPEGDVEKIYEYLMPNISPKFGILYSSDHMLYVGLGNGFVRFNPEKMIDTDTIVPTPAILRVVYQYLKGKETVTKVLARDVFQGYSLRVDFHPASYKFYFNNFCFNKKENIQYQYKLDPYENTWNTTYTPGVEYLNLPPGNYVFRVKALDKNHVPSNENKIFLTVLPPWWKTPWFFALVFFITISIMIGIWHITLARAKLKNQLFHEQEMNQMKLRFFTNITHELKTLLTLIYSPLKKLGSGERTLQDFNMQLPFLFRNVQKLKNLLDQLLEFRKAEMEVLSVQKERRELIRDVKEIIDHFLFEASQENKTLRLETTLSSLECFYDPDKLSKILFNLISNAIKFTRPGGMITVRVDLIKKENLIKIEVKDNGTGIPPENLERIFEKYFSTDNNVSGSGIGLFLIKKLVEIQEGTIQVESTYGKGSTFTVFLPYHPDIDSGRKEEGNKKPTKKNKLLSAFESQEIKEDQKKNNRQKERSVLIVEDYVDLRIYLRGILEEEFITYTARDGLEGYEKALEIIPDIIISDIMMPEMDGYLFCEKVKNDLRISHIPIILLTAKTTVEDQQEGYRSGADAYLTKPFDEELLLSQIEALLRNRELLKQRFSHDFGVTVEDLTHSHTDEKFLHKAISIIEGNMGNLQLDVEMFVEHLGMNRTMVYRKIKALTGKSPVEFIQHIRLQRAATLIVKTNRSISEIGYMCGFPNHSYFSAVFKKQFGMSPSEYRHHHTANPKT